jgi:hypothetical protein
MTKLVAALAVVVAAWVPAIAGAQEVAGRVLVAVGDVAVVRGAQRIAAQRGTEVRAGDTIQVGARSNTQLRLTDESIISLRPDTTFRLTEYAFSGKQPPEQRAFYQLIAGGIRTVTGLIGKVNQENYGVKTETATIGIRGTHFSLVECNNSCRNPNGTMAPNGTYGGVTDGRISVTNQAGQTVFGSDQFFQVASASAAPTQLIAPPGFLRDTLEGRTRNQRPAGTPQAAQPTPTQAQASEPAASSSGSTTTVLAPTGAGAGTGDSGVSASITTTTAPAVLTTNVFQSTTEASTVGPAAILQPTSTGTVFYRMQSPFTSIPVSCNIPPCGSVVAGDFTLAVNLTLQRAAIGLNLLSSGGDIINTGSPGAASGFPITVSGGQVSFSGTFNLADFPQNQGAFRCSTCGPGNTPGFLQSISVTGTITGDVATVKFTGTDSIDAFTFPLTLTLQTPPNSAVAAIATPRSAGGVDSRSFAFWNVQVDASGKLLGAGPSVGGPLSAVHTASNIPAGSDASAGNLVWGRWSGGGALITDSNYATFVTGPTSVQPWITGTAPNTLPPSLGTLTYTPIGSFMSGTGVLDSASITADFVARSLSLGIKATNPSAGNAFQMNAVTGFSTLNGRFSAGFNTVTCTGPCNSGATPTGSFGGFFAGANAEGAGLVFSTGFATPGTGVTGAVAFKR